jgi:hypothetical protein
MLQFGDQNHFISELIGPLPGTFTKPFDSYFLATSEQSLHELMILQLNQIMAKKKNLY